MMLDLGSFFGPDRQSPIATFSISDTVKCLTYGTRYSMYYDVT